MIFSELSQLPPVAAGSLVICVMLRIIAAMSAVIPHPNFFFVVNITPFHPNFDGGVAKAVPVFPIAGHPTFDGAVFIMPFVVVAGAIITTVANFHTAAISMMTAVAIFPDVMADAAYNDAAEKTS